MRAEKVRHGGFLGFFARERFEVAVEIPDAVDLDEPDGGSVDDVAGGASGSDGRGDGVRPQGPGRHGVAPAARSAPRTSPAGPTPGTSASGGARPTAPMPPPGLIGSSRDGARAGSRAEQMLATADDDVVAALVRSLAEDSPAGSPGAPGSGGLPAERLLGLADRASAAELAASGVPTPAGGLPVARARTAFERYLPAATTAGGPAGGDDASGWWAGVPTPAHGIAALSARGGIDGRVPWTDPAAAAVARAVDEQLEADAAARRHTGAAGVRVLAEVDEQAAAEEVIRAAVEGRGELAPDATGTVPPAAAQPEFRTLLDTLRPRVPEPRTPAAPWSTPPATGAALPPLQRGPAAATRPVAVPEHVPVDRAAREALAARIEPLPEQAGEDTPDETASTSAPPDTAPPDTAPPDTAPPDTAPLRHRSVRHRSLRHRSLRHRSTRHRSTRHRSTRHRSTRHRSPRHRSPRHRAARHAVRDRADPDTERDRADRRADRNHGDERHDVRRAARAGAPAARRAPGRGRPDRSAGRARRAAALPRAAGQPAHCRPDRARGQDRARRPRLRGRHRAHAPEHSEPDGPGREAEIGVERRALRRLGIPTSWIRRYRGGDRFAGVMRMLDRLPVLDIDPDTRIVAVVGPAALVTLEAHRTALDLPVGDRPRTVVVVPPGKGQSRRTVVARVQKLDAGVVAIATDGYDDVEAVLDTLQAVGAGAVVAVVEAGRDFEATQAWLEALEDVDALVVEGAAAVSDPAAVLRLDLPVVRLDGIPVDRVTWSALLCARLVTATED